MRKANLYPPKIERLNAWTHLIGVAYALLTAYWILSRASKVDTTVFTGVIVFLIGLVSMFTISSLYHLAKDREIKWKLKKADHISIYFMIAGSYTPFMLIYLNNRTGMTMLAVIWILTIAGTIFKIYTTGKFRYLSTAIYVLMGIAILLISDTFFAQISLRVGYLIVFGGASYIIGALFYLCKSWKYHHPVWHLFVLGGAICHWLGVWFSL